MIKFYSIKQFILILLVVIGVQTAFAGSNSLWTKKEVSEVRSSRQWYPNSYSTFTLQTAMMKEFLLSAPMELNAASRKSSYVIELPMPDGSLQHYTLVESPVMEKGLADAFPGIKTYAGVGIEDPSAYMRCDITEFGFHGFVLSPNGIFFIDPFSNNTTSEYIVYYKRDIPADLYDWHCGLQSDESEVNMDERRIEPNSAEMIGTTLRTYRLALACTYEYALTKGGTKAGALAGMVTTMNRVNGVYELELDIHMNIIANDTLLIYITSSDPYTNNDGATMLGENQTNVTTLIGSANYDIGHVFSTGGGGIAGLGVVCNTSNKARGVTGSPSPVGDAFDIDYVAHEMGHQFGGNHTFNSVTSACSGGNRAATAAYEPGSGSTIMAYAGICGSDNLQAHSDAYFHTKSFDEITTFTTTGAGNGCAVQTPSGNNPPTVTIPSVTYYIPIKTPFALTATGSDPDGESITYCWEQYNLGGSGQAWNVQTSGVNAPIFRSFNPVSTGTKLFPKLSKILTPSSTSIGEVLPIYARTLNFRCTVRDNHAGCGGVVHSTGTTLINVVASDTGGFAILTPNTTGITYVGNSTQTVTWHVAGTTTAPISAANVNIYLSTDNGQTFPYTIATNVPNNGSYSYSVPNVATTQARLKVEGAGKIFFDINDRTFTITFSTGINENILANSVNIYPNPAVSELNCVVNTAKAGSANIEIRNMLGQAVKRLSFEKQSAMLEKKIDISDLANGTYSVHFYLPEGVAQRQFIKQ